MRLCFANMGIDMKGQLTFCLAFYVANPSFLPVFVPPQFVYQKIVLRRTEIHFSWGVAWQEISALEAEERYLSASVNNVNKYNSEKETVNQSCRAIWISDVCSMSNLTLCTTRSVKQQWCCRFPTTVNQKGLRGFFF